MNKTLWIIVLIAVLGGWYWYAHRTPTTTTPATTAGLNGSENQTNTGQASVTPLLMVSTDAKLGQYVVATNGMTLYKYTKDTPGVSNCSGTCAQNWPPYTVSATEALVATAAASGKLTTITRADGSIQLAYNGMPLYFWKNDVKAGDTTGQNVGGVWFVVAP